MSPLLVGGDRAAVAAGIVRWAQRCGSDTDEVRDAAHEASHALEFKVRRWRRETIHGEMATASVALLARTEIDARAVERLVCAALGVQHDWRGFVALCAMEAVHSGVHFPSLEALDASIQRAMEVPRVVERAALILAMGREHQEPRDV